MLIGLFLTVRMTDMSEDQLIDKTLAIGGLHG